MRGTITIIDNHIKLTLDPENDLEAMVFRELGDEISISRAHQSIVLKRRGQLVHTLTREENEEEVEELTDESVGAVRVV